jgi:hypothetical protein
MEIAKNDVLFVRDVEKPEGKSPRTKKCPRRTGLSTVIFCEFITYSSHLWTLRWMETKLLELEWFIDVLNKTRCSVFRARGLILCLK